MSDFAFITLTEKEKAHQKQSEQSKDWADMMGNPSISKIDAVDLAHNILPSYSAAPWNILEL